MSSGRKTIEAIAKITGSNILKLFSGVLVGFILPKIIGLSDYGYYKTFTLYASYVGLFGIGLLDGIYLKYAGMTYEELQRSRFRLYTKSVMAIQGFTSIILLCVSLVFLKGEYRVIFSGVAVYLVSNNITGYFQIISQITNRFDELANRNVIQSILISASVLLLWVGGSVFHVEISYRLYMWLFVFISAILAMWYIFTYKDIAIGKSEKLKRSTLCDLVDLIKLGFPLLVSNLCSSLMLSVDRQFVNLLFENTVYAVYAFAYNMLSLVTTATSAVATVLYPTLKKGGTKSLKANYPRFLSIAMCLSFLCLLVYYPLCWIVDTFLFKYHGSLQIFRIIFPGLAISSCITIVMHTYYKLLEQNKRFFIISIVILMFSIFANFIAFTGWKSTVAISIASIISLFIWYIISDAYFIKKYRVQWKKNLAFLILMTTLFYVVTVIENYIVGFVVQAVVTLLIEFVFYKSEIIKFSASITK